MFFNCFFLFKIRSADASNKAILNFDLNGGLMITSGAMVWMSEIILKIEEKTLKPAVSLFTIITGSTVRFQVDIIETND